MVVLFQLSDRFIIGNDQPVEAPLFFKKIDHKLDVGGTRDSVDIVIGGHYASNGSVLQHLLKGKTVGIEQFVHSGMQGSMVSSALTAAVADKVLERGQRLSVFPLQTVDIGDRHLSDEIRIFTERLLQASPSGIAGDVENRRQALVNAHRAQLVSDRFTDFLHQPGIPG